MAVHIVPYDPNWSQLFEDEAKRIKLILGESCLSIHHIGSTSIPGTSAKPTIDIMVIVKTFQSLDLNALTQLGYENNGLIATPLSFFYRKPSYHIHLLEEGDGQIQRHAHFLAFLKTHPGAIQDYVHLKSQLAEKYKDSTQPNLYTYTLDKSDLIYSYVAQSGFDGLTVNYVRSPREWEAYHTLRKKEIFDTTTVIYDLTHRCFTDPNHFHFSLVKGVTMIGVAHIEILDKDRVALRPFAIDKLYQGQGFGKYFLSILEKWTRYQRRKTILLHARAETVGFYHTAGYREMPFPDKDPPLYSPCIDMGKSLKSLRDVSRRLQRRIDV